MVLEQKQFRFSNNGFAAQRPRSEYLLAHVANQAGSWNFVAHCGCYPSVATSAIILKLDCFQILGLNRYTLPVKVTETVWRFEPQRYLMLTA